MTTTRHIIDITADLVHGFEAGETSDAKNIAYEILEWTYVPDSGDAIMAADRVVEALIKAGWRPTVEQPAAEHHELPDDDAPTDAEVQTAGEAIYAAATGLIPPTCDLGTYWTDLARVALVAAREVGRHE